MILLIFLLFLQYCPTQEFQGKWKGPPPPSIGCFFLELGKIVFSGNFSGNAPRLFQIHKKMFEVEKRSLDCPHLILFGSDCHHRHCIVCVSVQLRILSLLLRCHHFPLWWEERRPPLHLLISYPTAFDQVESQKGISDMQCVCRESASVNIHDYATGLLRLLTIQINGLLDLACCLFLIIGTDRFDRSDLSQVYESRAAWRSKDCIAI